MKSKLVAAVLTFASICHGSPLQAKDGELVMRQSPGPGSYFAITGATGGIHPRLEIRELEKTGDMWNLFLLAMAEFQAMDQNKVNSYYEIAGIHGMPWRPWDGVPGNFEDLSDSQMGYCPHTNLLFGTWHRPYLALFEQQLQAVAKKIANEAPESSRKKYQDLAIKLRLPYWDWAQAVPANQPTLPTALTKNNVQITKTDGSKAEIRNPLYEYRFPENRAEINSTGCKPMGSLPEVCEYKMTVRKGMPNSDHQSLENSIRGILPGQRRLLFSILSQWQHFNTFSNDGDCRIGRAIGSLETLHNPIHVQNFPGHMSPTSVSAFDPMFWFHHANVDRQLALFQAIYPDTYIEPCKAYTPTYTIARDEMLNATSPLKPFHKNAAGDFWTSSDSRNIQDFSYTYPELVGNPSNATLIANIKAQYSDASNAKVKRQETAPTKGRVYLAEITLPLAGFSDGKGTSSPYNVHTFLGDVPSDPKEWLKSESYVSVTSTMGGKNMDLDQSVVVTVDLTAALETNGKASDDTVVDYLKDNLHWRLGLGDFELTREEVKGVKVSLLSTEVEFSHREDVFDRWIGGYTEYGPVDV